MRLFFPLLSLSLTSCGAALTCGEGTHEDGDVCVSDWGPPGPDDSDPVDDTEETEDTTLESGEEEVVGERVFVGDIVFTDEPGMEGFCLQHDVVYGNVIVRGDKSVLLDSLGCLKSVSGTLTISGGLLTSVSLPNLTEVSSTLTVTDVPLATAIQLGALRSVGGNLILNQAGGFPSLLSLQLPALQTVGLDIRLDDTTACSELRLPALTSIGRHLWVRRNSSVVTFSAPQLASLQGALRFDDNDALTTIDLSQLTQVGAGYAAELAIEHNDVLTSLSALHGIDRIGGSLTIRFNPLLPLAEAEGLRDAIGVADVGGIVLIEENQPPAP